MKGLEKKVVPDLIQLAEKSKDTHTPTIKF